jgi:hypothetical protein
LINTLVAIQALKSFRLFSITEIGHDCSRHDHHSDHSDEIGNIVNAASFHCPPYPAVYDIYWPSPAFKAIGVSGVSSVRKRSSVAFLWRFRQALFYQLHLWGVGERISAGTAGRLHHLKGKHERRLFA